MGFKGGFKVPPKSNPKGFEVDFHSPGEGRRPIFEGVFKLQPTQTLQTLPPENPPKMEAWWEVRMLVFRSFFVLEGFLPPRGPKRAPRVNFGRILAGVWGGLGGILEEF